MAKKLTIVLSQHQGKHPIKRQLEEEIAARLMIERDVELALLPHLYDLTADHTGMLFLRGVNGPLVVFSWLFHRASRWVLDRQGIRGREGLSLLNTREESDEELDEAKQLEEREEREQHSEIERYLE